MRIAAIGCAAFWFYVVSALSGCAVPLLLGVKEVRTAGGTEVKFITGGDFRIGANGIDTVEDNRGIRPGGGARGAVQATKNY
jgi:hypothetical protein